MLKVLIVFVFGFSSCSSIGGVNFLQVYYSDDRFNVSFWIS